MASKEIGEQQKNDDVVDEWIIPVNPKQYNHREAFRKYGILEKEQNASYQVGDIVYVYSTLPDQIITCVTKVEKINIKSTEREVDDTEFIVGDKKEDKDVYVRLKLISECECPELSLDVLLKHGLLYAPQGPNRVKGELRDYIHSVINSKKDNLVGINKIYYGIPGCGKSYYIENTVLKEEATEETCGDILFITNEMGEDEIKERLDCIRFKLPYKSFLEGTLTEREKRRYYKGLEKLKSEKSKIRILYSCQTIDELTTQIGLYQPSVVFIDGSYLMEPQRDEGWEKIVYVTRNLKRIAKNTNVPIVNTTQLKRGSSKGASKFALDAQEDFAYSSSYTQDSDIALRMFQDADMKFHDLVGLEVAKGRRVVSGTQLIFQNDLTNMLQSVTLPADEPEPERKDDF